MSILYIIAAVHSWTGTVRAYALIAGLVAMISGCPGCGAPRPALLYVAAHAEHSLETSGV